MSMLKIRNQHGGWDEIVAIRGRDGAIQYTAGANIEITPDNVISAKGLENSVTREDVTEMINASVPKKVSDLPNDANYITSASVPTKTSELTNDAGYITSDDVPKVPTKTSELTNDSGFVNSSAIPTKTSELTNDSNFAKLTDIPTVPTKLSELNNDAGYLKSSDVGTGLLTINRNNVAIGTFNANETINKTVNIVVPTTTSELTNDSGFVNSSAIPTKTSELTNDSNFAKLTDIPTVPTKLSDLTNDAGYLQYNDVGTGLLTIKRNNESIGTFNANETVNKTVNISVPTATSELTNNSGFITKNDVPDAISKLNDDVGIVTQTQVLTDLNNKLASLKTTVWDQYKTTNDTDVLSRFAFLNFMRKKATRIDATFTSTNPSTYVGAKIWFYIEGNMVHMLGDIHFDGSKGPNYILNNHNTLLQELVANVNVVANNAEGYATKNLFALFETGHTSGSDRSSGSADADHHDYEVDIPAIWVYYSGENARASVVRINAVSNSFQLVVPSEYLKNTISEDDFPYLYRIRFEAWAHFPFILHQDSRWD